MKNPLKLWHIEGIAPNVDGQPSPVYARIMEGDRVILESTEMLNVDLEDLQYLVDCANRCKAEDQA